MRLVALFSFLLVLGCTSDNSIGTSISDINTQSFTIYNHTGHLIRRGGEKCGDAVQVAFALSSPEDRQEYVINGDNIQSVSLIAERGQTINVSAYEVDGLHRTLLTQRSMTFDPPADSDRQVIPSIILCPKDQMEFYDFN